VHYFLIGVFIVVVRINKLFFLGCKLKHILYNLYYRKFTLITLYKNTLFQEIAKSHNYNLIYLMRQGRVFRSSQVERQWPGTGADHVKVVISQVGKNYQQNRKFHIVRIVTLHHSFFRLNREKKLRCQKKNCIPKDTRIKNLIIKKWIPRCKNNNVRISLEIP